MNILCTICARGGSKGVPGKNIRILAGLPLIAHSIRFAKSSPLVTDIVVSTDDLEIKRVAEEHGALVPFLRPAELAGDDAPKLPVIRHATDQMEKHTGRLYDIAIDLDVTSPLRRLEDLKGVLQLMEERQANAVLTATASSKNPYFNMVEVNPEGWIHVVKETGGTVVARQAAPRTYDLNGSIYAFRRSVLDQAHSAIMARTALWVMPENYGWDIDRELDFRFVELLLQENHG